jgi:DNA mismatch repair protein MutS
MAVREWGGEVLFLRRVVEQPASRSYGIEVAKLAGLPTGIITRARQILSNLEQGELDSTGKARLARNAEKSGGGAQLGLFTPTETRALEELRTVDIDRLAPVDALTMLAKLKSRLSGND